HRGEHLREVLAHLVAAERGAHGRLTDDRIRMEQSLEELRVGRPGPLEPANEVVRVGRGHATLTGRGTSSPAQFGHVPPIPPAQSAQKVHSKLQIRAWRDSGGSGAEHRSHVALISSMPQSSYGPG